MGISIPDAVISGNNNFNMMQMACQLHALETEKTFPFISGSLFFSAWRAIRLNDNYFLPYWLISLAYASKLKYMHGHPSKIKAPFNLFPD